ncbi:MAG: methyl-accepting chemotaxis protein [Cyanobacteriota bacterium]|nr:methyl-accepting chemotaxis protein [Cyanobacteriota bacterium]
MVDNRKLAVIIWLKGVIPLSTYILQVLLIALSVNTAYNTFDREQQYEAKIENLQNSLAPSEKAELDRAEQQVENSFQRVGWVVLVTSAIQIVFVTNFFRAAASEVSQRLGKTVKELDSFSSEIANTMALQEQNTSQQAAAVNQTTTTMDELNASSQQSAEQASSAAEQAQQGLHLAESGLKAVEQTESAMSVLSHQMRDLQAQIFNLTDKANEIGKISKLVSDLANQTNMLALNAAVEAVRAGEHGKGFAVVAQEIRQLADRSKGSTNSIEALVADIQTAIDSTVSVTKEGSQMVDNGVEMSQETANSFRGVTSSIDNIALNAQQISLNAKQQALAIQQVVETMNSINQTAAGTATSISLVKMGTEKLDRAVQVLKKMA